MPNISPATDTDRKRYRRTLRPRQGQLFDELVELVDHPQRDLDWYYRLGKLVHDLRGSAKPESRSHGWLMDLAKSLGPSVSVLTKASRFVELYPSKDSLDQVKATGTDWTHLTLAFSVTPSETRHSLLQKAVAKKWSPRELLHRIQSRSGKPQRITSGRPRKSKRFLNFGPAAVLRELLRRTVAWTDFQNEAFSHVTAKEWSALALTEDEQQSNWIYAQLKSLDALLAGMHPEVQKMLLRIRKLRNMLEHSRGIR